MAWWLLLAEVADVLDLAAQDVDRGAHGRVLAGDGDAARRGGGALFLFLLGDGLVAGGVLLEDLQRGAEAEGFFEGGVDGGARVLVGEAHRVEVAFAEGQGDAGAVDLL